MTNRKVNKTWVFRPVDYSYRLKKYYAHCPKGPHWMCRTKSYSKFNTFKYRIFQIVHHYAAHAPEAVRKGWKKAAKRQEIRFGKTGSMRWINKYTAHSYL